VDEQGPLSARNPRIRHLRRLIGRRSARTEHGQFTFEGVTLVADAITSSFPLDAVYLDAETASDHAELVESLPGRTAVFTVAAGVIERVSDTTTSQGVVALAPRPTSGLESIEHDPDGWVVVLDAVSDPGNAGTIVRTAEAFGARAAVFTGAGADPFGPKTVRAAAGSAFRLPIVEHDEAVEVMRRLLAAGFEGCTTVVAGGEAPNAVDLTGALALVLGNEAHGVDPGVRGLHLHRLTIPMVGAVESLNVAAAAAIVGYERVRQVDAAASGQ
jgi:TrmH family RNA methyltransferase